MAQKGPAYEVPHGEERTHETAGLRNDVLKPLGLPIKSPIVTRQGEVGA